METGPTTLTGCPHTGLVGEKTRGVFLLLGVFLCLMGSVFTITGCLERPGEGGGDHPLEWESLLGPIMLSAGGVFMLIRTCSFRMFPCLPHRLTGERAEEEEAAAEHRGAAELSFVFNGVQPPVVFHCAAQFSPPPYDSLAPPPPPQQQQQHHHQLYRHRQLHPVGDRGPPPPCFHHLFPVENAAFTSEDGFPLGRGRALTRPARSRVLDGQQGEEKDEDNSSTCSPPPPAYEDIYPPA
ncbi:transmembrane protein 174 [Gadus macrocephalus]|uniref:transmembrane protein 174 n=1 Tax=Gadus macrocephalus TaxID=80720 RepID=UPI0028CB8DE4|nr:transmembrane protein 174 [Gadus macrocephalus]